MHKPKQFAGIPFEKGFDVDALMAQLASDLHARGIGIAGVVQTCDPETVGEDRDLHLTSVNGDWSLPVMQNRGSLSSGCRLDYSAVAEASSRIAAAITPATRIVILNRFGRAESEGNGFRSILEKCLEEGYTALCAVRSDYVADWEAFHGGLAETLPATREAILDWCLARETQSDAAE